MFVSCELRQWLVRCGCVLSLGGWIGGAWAQETPQRDFQTFVKELEAEAVSKGVRPDVAASALSNVTHIDRVVELDRRQPEFTFTLEQYLGRVVSADKVEKGRRMWVDNKTLLDKIQKKYGVPSKYVVALWGIETDYGRVTGGFSVVSALATLAFDGRRSTYFRGELMNALKIIDEGHIAAADMTGSWAGALGQCQFMPSSFLRLAEDGDGDGRRDIWNTRADVFASASNYLAKSGWINDQGWGRAVKLPKQFSDRLIGLEEKRSTREWSKLGVMTANGKPLPESDIEGSIIVPKPGNGQAYLVYENFRTLMKWNKSFFFALAAGTLADKISAH